MPNYIYKCLPCSQSYANQIESGDVESSDENYESSVLFETSHPMNPTQKEKDNACVCPRCQSKDVEKTLYGHNFTTYVRGYGWLDKNGVHRDMHTYTLMNNDPFKEHRQPGETHQIKETLAKKGKVNPRTQYFGPKVTQADVAQAVNKNTTS